MHSIGLIGYAEANQITMCNHSDLHNTVEYNLVLVDNDAVLLSNICHCALCNCIVYAFCVT